MTVQVDIPRAVLLWLLLAQGFIVALHISHLPVWLLVLWGICSLWRIQIFRMRLAYPGRWLKIVLVGTVATGVYLSRGQLIGLDAGVVLLVAAFLLKLLEMRSKRDAWVLIFIAFFVIGTAYLFDTGLLMTLFSVIPLFLLLAAMIALQGQQPALKAKPTLALAGSLLLQSLPLMLLLFVFFPRMGPLWSLPMPSDKGMTGLSDRMSPNDIAELSRSSALAFRATFEGPLPSREQLYWRAMTLEGFDGRVWYQLSQAPVQIGQREGVPTYQYQVLAQPSGETWLFALDLAESQNAAVEHFQDGRLEAKQRLDSPMAYQVQSWPGQLPSISADWQMRRLLQLPEQGEPRARAWAQQLRQQHPDEQELVANLLRHFNQQPYVYTLRPLLMGENAIDEFLFDNRRGFCAHYAGAMVFLLRAAGIPARVVAGYQGGEFGPGEKTIQVRQFDAHAWVEYWSPKLGWRSVDPTAAVAPERIESGLEAALAGEQSFLEDSPFSPLRYRHLGWLNELRLGLDQLDHNWQQWVLNYQAQEQEGLLKRWFGRGFDRTLLIGLSLTVLLLLVGLSLFLLKPWRTRLAPEQRLQQRFEQMLKAQGVVRLAGEGPQDFAQRAAQLLPKQAAFILAFAQAYTARCYAGDTIQLPALRRHLRQLRRALLWP